jgi:hypothetical protein
MGADAGEAGGMERGAVGFLGVCPHEFAGCGVLLVQNRDPSKAA